MDQFMQIAVDEARATKAEGGSPYGGVLVRNGKILGKGRNLSIQNNDPLSHGETEAIRDAGLLQSYEDTVMYASAFPCLMCAGAIVKLGIPKVIVGAAFGGHEASLVFMESHGVEVILLDDPACREVVLG